MKTYAIMPMESEARKFDALVFQTENLENVLIVHVPDDSSTEEVINFRDTLIVAVPDKTVIVVPESVKFCRIKEVEQE